jgi:hypothetical protein
VAHEAKGRHDSINDLAVRLYNAAQIAHESEQEVKGVSRKELFSDSA